MQQHEPRPGRIIVGGCQQAGEHLAGLVQLSRFNKRKNVCSRDGLGAILEFVDLAPYSGEAFAVIGQCVQLGQHASRPGVFGFAAGCFLKPGDCGVELAAGHHSPSCGQPRLDRKHGHIHVGRLLGGKLLDGVEGLGAFARLQHQLDFEQVRGEAFARQLANLVDNLPGLVEVFRADIEAKEALVDSRVVWFGGCGERQGLFGVPALPTTHIYVGQRQQRGNMVIIAFERLFEVRLGVVDAVASQFQPTSQIKPQMRVIGQFQCVPDEQLATVITSPADINLDEIFIGGCEVRVVDNGKLVLLGGEG